MQHEATTSYNGKTLVTIRAGIKAPKQDVIKFCEKYCKEAYRMFSCKASVIAEEDLPVWLWANPLPIPNTTDGYWYLFIE